RRTLALAESTTDLRYREVVENLAIIANDRWAIPSFASIYAGTADLSDTASASFPLVPYRTTLAPLFAGTFDLSASRAVKENWTLDPVVVPEKLRAIRCACWCVLDGTLYTDAGHGVYLNDYKNSESSLPGYYFDVATHLQASIQKPWIHEGTCHHAAYEANCH